MKIENKDRLRCFCDGFSDKYWLKSLQGHELLTHEVKVVSFFEGDIYSKNIPDSHAGSITEHVEWCHLYGKRRVNIGNLYGKRSVNIGNLYGKRRVNKGNLYRKRRVNIGN